MKLIVFGASRGVGRSLTEFALAEGHRVTAVVRSPANLELSHESLEVIAGDVTDAESVRRCLRGHEVVFCTVGADKRGATTLYSSAARNISTAMEDLGARRLAGSCSCRTSACWERRAQVLVLQWSRSWPS